MLALNRLNVFAVATLLVLHLGVTGHHVPCHYDFMFRRRSHYALLSARRGARGRGWVWGAFARPLDSKEVYNAIYI